jgi:hypothetical protein
LFYQAAETEFRSLFPQFCSAARWRSSMHATADYLNRCSQTRLLVALRSAHGSPSGAPLMEQGAPHTHRLLFLIQLRRRRQTVHAA